jgi:hypothetical protein
MNTISNVATLRAIAAMLLPEVVISDRQLLVWLTMNKDIAIVEEGLVITAGKFQQFQNQGQRMTDEHVIRFTSSVCARISREKKPSIEGGVR